MGLDTLQLLELAAKRLDSEAPLLATTAPVFWRTFLRWLQSQVEYDRKVLIAEFAVAGLTRIDNEKILKLTLLDKFVLQHGLHHRVILYATQECT